MKIGSCFAGNYLKAEDIPEGRDVPVIMEDVKLEELDEGKDSKPVLYFRGKKKALILNKTNGNVIAEMYGDETDAWQGKTIVMFSTRVDFQGKRVPAIRIRDAYAMRAALPQQTAQFSSEQRDNGPKPIGVDPAQQRIAASQDNDDLPF